MPEQLRVPFPKVQGPAFKTQTGSPLLNLPPELRSRIYAHALADPKGIDVLQTKPTEPNSVLALRQTCKQIRAETAEMFYHHTIPVFNLSRQQIFNGCPEATEWLHRIGPERVRGLAGLRITCGDIFTLELEHITKVHAGGKYPGLVLKSLSLSTLYGRRPNIQYVHLIPNHERVKPVFDDTAVRASMNYALNRLFRDGGSNGDFDLSSFCGDRLVAGLAHFLMYTVENTYYWNFSPFMTALDFITGMAGYREDPVRGTTLMVPCIWSAKLNEMITTCLEMGLPP